MKKCVICDGLNERKFSEFCSKKCSDKDQYSKNRDKMIQKAAKWNRDNKDKRNKRDRKRGATVYYSIMDRCNNDSAPYYKYYGAKGVKCILTQDEFLEVYFSVSKCVLCNRELNDNDRNASNGRTIDRIDVNGNYEIGNVQIICRACNNKKDHTKLTDEQKQEIQKEYKWKSKEYGTIALAERYNVSQNTIWEIVKDLYKSTLTEEQDKEIVRLYKSGAMGTRAIAKKIGCVRNAVISAIKRIG